MRRLGLTASEFLEKSNIDISEKELWEIIREDGFADSFNSKAYLTNRGIYFPPEGQKYLIELIKKNGKYILKDTN